MNGDLISREALKKAFKEAYEGITFSLIECNDLIDNAPTVEPRIEYGTDGQPYKLSISNGKEFERPQGEWVEDVNDTYSYDHDTWECSVCHEPFTLICGTPKDNLYNFCPNCGADMREGGAE